MEQTVEMRPEVFERYISICDSQKDGESTSPALVEEIHDIFFYEHKGIKKSKLDDIWGTVCPRIQKNAGLAQFIIDFDGAKSDFFFPWLVNVWTSPSAALEMAYGSGRDLTGVWQNYLEDDEISYFVHNVPTFVYNRERQLKVADLAMTVQERTPLSRKSKVVDFGAGRMAWARWHGFRFYPTRQEIYAFDNDTSINPESFFRFYSPEVMGIRYKHSDFLGELGNPELEGADLIILGGVASYIPMETFASNIVPAIYWLLSSVGCFFFDLQLDCPQYAWSVKLFDWPEIQLMKSPAEAIDAVEAMRKKLWKAGLRMRAEYTLDTYSAVASSVMVTLTKI